MKSSKGFTLIELIVVMAIFLFVIGAALGIFLSIIQNQKKVLAEQQFLNQISYVEEYMSKALRVAATDTVLTDSFYNDSSRECIPPEYIYQLIPYPAPASRVFNGIKFINETDNNTCEEFYLDNSTPGDTTTPLVLWQKKGTDSPVALTSSDVQIESVRFSINGGNGTVSGQTGCTGTDPCGAIASTVSLAQPQPRVTILFNLIIPGSTATKTVQTTVSRRNLNVQR